MLARDVAVLGAAIARHRNKKGKSTLMVDVPAWRDYGSAARTDRYRAASTSASLSGEHLQHVPEDDDDGSVPSTWINGDVEGAGSGFDNDGDAVEDEDESEDYDYRRAVRLYAIVPLGSFVFFFLFTLLPLLIQPTPLPHAPSAGRLALAVLLSAALWCLAHALRVPLYNLLSSIFSLLGLFLPGRHSRYTKFLTVFTVLAHAALLAVLQESLRLVSFTILAIHWLHTDPIPDDPYPHAGARVNDAVFREVWALALGWALAEVCAGVLQGYEQLALYEDADPAEYCAAECECEDGDEEGHHMHEPHESFDEEGEDYADEDALGLVRRSVWMADGIAKASPPLEIDVDAALARLANVKAREELEELYGDPYINIPVFVPILQRFDSLLFSLGITLLLSAAYLPPLPFNPPGAPPSSHILPLVPTFAILTLAHSALGVLHAPPMLGCVGLPAAAYTSCMVGLAVTFAGIGVWIGVW